MHLFHIPQSTVQNSNLHISVQNGILLNMGQVHFEICETGLFALVVTSADMITLANSNSANRVRHHINTKKGWWRHQIEISVRVTGRLWGESTGGFPSQRPVTRSYSVFFDLHLNKRLTKQWSRWWFEMLSRSLLRHCSENKQQPATRT